MISMDEGDDKKLASCFVENGIMEIVKVRALRTTLLGQFGFPPICRDTMKVG